MAGNEFCSSWLYSKYLQSFSIVRRHSFFFSFFVEADDVDIFLFKTRYFSNGCVFLIRFGTASPAKSLSWILPCKLNHSFLAMAVELPSLCRTCPLRGGGGGGGGGVGGELSR